ncbi:MAG TPA: LysM peptidoglycan-binding domain-containing protein, partial [Waddliaceae bacterium]
LASKEVNEAIFVNSKPQPQEILIETNLSSSPRDELDQMLKDYPLNASAAPSLAPEETQSVLQPAISTSRVDSPKSNKEKDYVEVTVKRGDYLEKIAKANGTTIEAIMKGNKLSSERLDIGQILKIPLPQKKVAETAAAKKNVNKQPDITQSDVQFYTLKSGDNPWKVAKEFRVKFDDLLRLNNLDEEKAKGLKPGDVLRVH